MGTPIKHGLGRGLSALIPPKPLYEGEAAAGVRQVDISQIEPNPRQPRRHIPTEALDELAASIREHGLLQPLLVKEVVTAQGLRFQLIAGERRWRAAQRAGLSTVPVIVKGATPQQMLEMALVENVQRADLNALEEAEAYRQLIEEFHLTQEQVARKVGKDRTTIANALRLLKMPDVLKEAVVNETLTEGHARALMQLADETKLKGLLQTVVARHLSVRQTEELVRRTLASAPRARTSSPNHGKPNGNTPHHTRADMDDLEQELRRALGTKVELYRSQRGGKIIIEFYSDEELDAIYRRIVDK